MSNYTKTEKTVQTESYKATAYIKANNTTGERTVEFRITHLLNVHNEWHKLHGNTRYFNGGCNRVYVRHDDETACDRWTWEELFEALEAQELAEFHAENRKELDRIEAAQKARQAKQEKKEVKQMKTKNVTWRELKKMGWKRQYSSDGLTGRGNYWFTPCGRRIGDCNGSANDAYQQAKRWGLA